MTSLEQGRRGKSVMQTSVDHLNLQKEAMAISNPLLRSHRYMHSCTGRQVWLTAFKWVIRIFLSSSYSRHIINACSDSSVSSLRRNLWRHYTNSHSLEP